MTNKNSKKALLGALFLALILASFGVFKFLQSQEQAPQPLPARRGAPDFSLPNPAGKSFSLKDFEGRAVLIHFWAAWCPPCLEEIRQFAAVASRYDRGQVAFVPISQDPRWEDALKILPDKGLAPNLVSLLDASGRLAERFGTYQFPETFLLDSRHEIVHKWIGPQNWTSPEVQERILRAASGR